MPQAYAAVAVVKTNGKDFIASFDDPCDGYIPKGRLRYLRRSTSVFAPRFIIADTHAIALSSFRASIILDYQNHVKYKNCTTDLFEVTQAINIYLTKFFLNGDASLMQFYILGGIIFFQESDSMVMQDHVTLGSSVGQTADEATTNFLGKQSEIMGKKFIRAYLLRYRRITMEELTLFFTNVSPERRH